VGSASQSPPPRQSWLSRAIPFVLLASLIAGVAALFPQLAFIYVAVAIVVAALLVLARLARPPSQLLYLGLGIGALLVPIFALLGIDWAWAKVGAGRLSPVPSLLVAAAIVSAATFVYLRPWWVGEALDRPALWAAAVVAVLLLLPIVIVEAIGLINGDGVPEPKAAAVSQLDVIVLRGETAPTTDAVRANLRGWRIHAWTGAVGAGDEVRWGAEGPPPVVPEDDADRVVLLMPGEDHAPDAAHWANVADAVEPRTTTTYALLPTADDDGTLRQWHDAVFGRGGRPGDAIAMSHLKVEGVFDIALHLAALSPTADEDLALATRYRPALFFDGSERYPRPRDIDGLLDRGLMRVCDAGQRVRALCPKADGAGSLRSDMGHLAFDPDEVATADVGSTIYVNVSRSGNDARNAVYLDYWWYLPHNPADAGGGAFCGAGFVIAEITCFDHQSDWEGVTVVLNGDRPGAPPIAVDYAQHNGNTRFTWAALQALWRRNHDLPRFGAGIDVDHRPLVFVARGTHASYERHCDRGLCTVGGVPGHRSRRPFKENRHDGRSAWEGNTDAGCAARCVAALPARHNGQDPASWNAWPGEWGTANCVLVIVCSSSEPPRSPAHGHERYSRPWCVAEFWNFRDDRFAVAARRICTRKPSADELHTGERLLAVGDSYSSGEGAGDYDADSSACHRSPRSWPIQFARRRHLVALPPLACSGAVTADVLGRQIPAIDGDPDIITLTIGGNDAGFAHVLEDCVLGNCKAKYHRPERDLLDERAARLAQRLPGVYRAIRDAAPHARLVVSGYPKLFPSASSASPVRNCAVGRTDKISAAEGDYLNEKLVSLDAAIAGAAQQAGAVSVDVTDAFAGHELRCTGESYLNKLRLGEKVRSASFHPTAAGYARLAQVVDERLKALDERTLG
jgi:lysophospholipase L1-like esterase